MDTPEEQMRESVAKLILATFGYDQNLNIKYGSDVYFAVTSLVLQTFGRGALDRLGEYLIRHDDNTVNLPAYFTVNSVIDRVLTVPKQYVVYVRTVHEITAMCEEDAVESIRKLVNNRLPHQDIESVRAQLRETT